MHRGNHHRRRTDIVFVIGSLDLGGAERHLFQVLPELKNRGWMVQLYCVSRRGVMADALEEKGIPVFTPSIAGSSGADIGRRLLRLIAATWGLTAHLCVNQPSAVHFFLPQAYMLGAVCALIARTPVRIMSRRSLNDYQKKRPISRWLERVLHHTTHRVLGNSLAVVDQLRGEGLPAGKIDLIYNGIEVGLLAAKRARAEVRSALGIEADTLVFIMVANLIHYKGHSDALRAFALARSGLKQRWVFLVVGRDDGIGHALREESENLGLGRHVLWVGMRHDVADLLFASDVGMLCSHQEGFSNAILEAMGAGLPVVATDVGGNAEAVVHGSTGYIVPARSPRHLAAALVALADKDRRLTMGKAARERVESRFTLSRCVDAYEICYHLLGTVPAADDYGRHGSTIL